MDTRFWGPSGWSLLHAMASAYQPTPANTTKYRHFFDSLPVILPCIYCRQSLTQYFQELPLRNSDLQSNLTLQHWLYQIHEKVNNKLRSQGLDVVETPPFADVVQKYQGSEDDMCLHGWDFLYAIAMNYPTEQSRITTQLRHNYRIFFDSLADLFPNPTICRLITRYRKELPLSPCLESRDYLVKWLYGIENQSMENCPCFDARCQSIERYRAGCKGKWGEKPTCRRIKRS